MNCINHGDKPAQGFCAACGKPFCEHCLIDVSGVPNCRNCLSEGTKENNIYKSNYNLITTSVPDLTNNKALSKRALIIIKVFSVGILLFLLMGGLVYFDTIKEQAEDAKPNAVVYKTQEEREEAEINIAIEDRVTKEYDNVYIKKVVVNMNLGTQIEGKYIVQINLRWDSNKNPQTSKKMLDLYGDDLATTLAQNNNVGEVGVFWEVPYLITDINAAKMIYDRSGNSMSVHEKWYIPAMR